MNGATEAGKSILLARPHVATTPPYVNEALLPPLRAPPDEQYDEDFTVQRNFDFGAQDIHGRADCAQL